MPKIFTEENRSDLTDVEKKRLVASWADRYIENEENDDKTMHTLISLLDKPSKHSDWKLACNYMKLIAVSLATRKVFIADHYDTMITSLIENIADILCN